MPTKRTDAVELDKDFTYVGEIVKSYVDEATGKRYIVGAATGLEEDQDGERVSKRAIAGMLNTISAGGVKVTGGSHEQNWLNEIGDVVEGHIDPETDQLMVKTELPPEGADPIADKAWTETHKRKMAWSVGGKLRAAYHELTDTGKKRKVLDVVDLRHLCLTDKPAYQHSFAHAVAKTFDADPADTEFKDEDIAKDVTGSWSPGGGGNSGQDSETGGKRNAGTKKPGGKGMSVDDDGKDKPEDDDDENTVEPAERHMSCPQCGHEFAADIPVDMTPEERQDQDRRKDELEDSVPGDGSGGGSKNDDEPDGASPNNQQDDDDEDGKKKKPFGSAKKSEEATMDLEKRIKDLEDLVAKQADELSRKGAAEFANGKIGDDVLKTATDEGVDPGVVKVIALATGSVDTKIEKTREELSEGFGLLGKAVMEIREVIGSLPQGRKSTARVLKSGREDDAEESVEERVEKAESPVEALKILNEHTYGIK